MTTAAQIRREASDAQILAAMFPGMSKSTRDANAAPSLASAPPPAPVAPRAADVPRLVTAPRVRSMEAPALNKTEQRWQAANPNHKPFPMSLRWGKCMTYKPDFLGAVGLVGSQRPVLVEVKGGHIFDRDIVRFKGCAAEWGWLFAFELWQWKNRDWKRLY